MANDFTVNQTIGHAPGGDTDTDGVVDPLERVRFTVQITNNSTDTDATGLQFQEILDRMTLFNQAGNDVNVSPIAFNDSYTAIGNTLLEVGNATAQTGPQKSVAGHVTDNDLEFFGDTFSISAVNLTASVGGAPVTITTANGGTVTMIASGLDMGSFTYVSAANFLGTDSFTYTIRDKGLDGIADNADDLVNTATVTIAVANQVWYVDASAGAGGTGTSTNPFNTLAAVSGASGLDDAGDIIYVNSGTYAEGVTLLNGQTLHGEGTALVVGGFNLAAAGADPTIANASGNSITLAQDNTLTGLTVGDTAAGSFDITNTAATTVGALTISNVDLTGTGGLFRADSGGVLSVVFDTATTTSATTGIQLAGATSGTLTASAGAISGVTGTDISIAGGTAAITIASSIASSAGGSIDVGTHNGDVTFSGAINITGGTGINVHDNTGGTILFSNASKVVNTGASTAVTLTNNTGATINFTNGGLDIDTTTGTGFTATGGGTLTIQGSNNSITTGATTGSALNLSGITVGNGAANGINLASVTTAGATNGILITNVAQGASSTGIDVLAGSIGSATLRGVDIDSTSADVSINATISTTATGRSVEVTNSGRNVAGGSQIIFSGGIDENGLGINLDNNDQNTNGAAISFTGGLDIDNAGTNTGFNAVNGGTVTVTGSNNTIDSVSGTALNVANTNIGSGNLTFLRISAGNATAAADPVNGIVLNTTGSAGGLRVTGDGGGSNNGTGGIIQNTSGDGILLTSTEDVRLGYMNIQNNLGDGIGGSSVNGLVFNRLNISGNGNSAATDESGINLANVTGTASTGSRPTAITNSVISNNFEFEVQIANSSGTLTNFQFLNNTVTANVSAAGLIGNVFNFLGTGTSTMGLTVTGGSFTGNHNPASPPVDNTGTGVHADTSGTAMTVSVTGATFTANNAGVNVSTGPGNSTLTFNITGNTFVDQRSTAINIFNNGNAPFGRTVNGTISGNIIGDGSDFSGSQVGRGIDVGNEGSVNMTVLITGNTIQDIGTPGVPSTGSAAIGSNIGISGNATGGGTTNLTITNNNISDIQDNRGILIDESQDTTGGGPFPTVFVNISGNTFSGFIGGAAGDGSRIRIDQDNGTFRVTQGLAGSGAGSLDAANTGVTAAQISAGGTISYNQGAPPTPPPFSPLPLMAGEDPASTDDSPPPEKDDGTGGELTPDDEGGGGEDGEPHPVPDPPRVDDPKGTPVPSVILDDGYLSQAELDFFVDAAKARWIATGLTPDQVAALQGLTFQIADMAGLNLGSFDAGVVTIDSDGASRGWYADETPLDDSEFANIVSSTRLVATAGTAPAGRFDLLTTIMHEMGHAIGLIDLYDQDSRDELLYGYLFAGERRLPGGDDGNGATPGTVTSQAFAGSTIQVVPADASGGLFTLPFNRTVTIQWDATVDAQSNGLIVNPVNQGSVSATNVGAFADANSNIVTTLLDTLTLGGTIWNDNGAGGGTAGNGAKDGTEPGINGVLVSLFVDANNDNVADTPGTALLTATTASGGNYTFNGLAPGNYIVRVDADNFNAGGNVSLVGFATTTGSADPDDNVDNDDNGFVSGSDVFSNAITLAYNTEPTNGPGNDTNTTVDFGVVDINDPPTLTATGQNPTYVEDAAAADLYSSVTASTVEAGQTLTSMTLTVTNVTDGSAEVLTFDGSQVALTHANAVTTATNGLNVNVAVSGTTATVSFAGASLTTAQVQTLVDALAYRNTSQNPTDANRVVTITELLDSGSNVSPDDNSATLNVVSTVNVDPVNDQPSGTNNTLTINEDLEYHFLLSDFGFSDVDGNNFAGVVVTTLPATGTLALNGTPLIAGNFVPQAVFGNFTYTPALNGNGTTYASFTFQVRDDGSNAPPNVNTDQLANTLTFNVTAVNDPPTIGNLNGNDVPFTEGGAPVHLDLGTNATVTDVDLPVDFAGGSLSLTFNIQANDAIGFDPTNGVTVNLGNGEVSVDDGGGAVVIGIASFLANGVTIALDGDATPARVQQVIRSVVYQNIDTINPSAVTRTFTWTLNDGDGIANGGDPDTVATTTVTFTAVNDAPTLQLSSGGPGSTLAYQENDPVSSLAPTAILTDGDSPNFGGGSLTVSFQANGTTDDQLDIVSVGGITLSGTDLLFNLTDIGDVSGGNNGADLVISFDSDATVAAVQAAIQAIGYSNTSNDPSALSRTVNFLVDDGDGGTSTAQANATVNFTAVNDPPTLTAVADNPNFTEGDPAVDIFDTVVASTVEAGQTFTSLTLTVTNVTNGADEVIFFDGSDVALSHGNVVVTAGNGLTVNVSASGTTVTLTFNGAALSAATLQTIVDGLTYRNTNTNPTDADRVVTITELVDSGPGTSPDDNSATLGVTSTIDVDRINDPANITGDTTGDVTEAGGVNNGTPGTPTATGNLDSTDTDDPADLWQVVAPGGVTIGGYGTYELSDSGVWTYTLDDNDPAVQALNGVATLIDTFSALTIDGTAQLVTITIHAQDDATVAQDDAFATDEATGIGTGLNLFDDNGSGADDPDGPAPVLTAVNGSALAVGTQITLPSGALLTVNVDGTFDYDPNGAFDTTPTSTSGATNQPSTDSFTYTLAVGGTATVTITIDGLDTDDVIVGPFAPATLAGGGGNDAYLLNDPANVVTELSGAGDDSVFTFTSYALLTGSEVEVLAARDPNATTALVLQGNELANRLGGNAGPNSLYGGGGLDLLYGFGGNDSYLVDSADDAVFENAGEGFDAVFATGNHALQGGSEVEILAAYLASGTTALTLRGNELANIIGGNAGSNSLYGGGGADLLYGLGGNDFYVVDSPNAAVFENVGEGFDSVFATSNHTLQGGSEVELLAAYMPGGTAPLILGGNEFANILGGNAGSNTLYGGGGADTFYGLGGDDFYVVDSVDDAVFEGVGGGFDYVFATGNHTLQGGSEVEVLAAYVLSGTAALVLRGNEFANRIVGNAGSNSLYGGGGADTFMGLGGNDFYVVDGLDSAVLENAGEGFDFVYTTVDHALADGSEVEVLAAYDPFATGSLILKGNALANTVIGNAGSNSLYGGGGTDSLAGLGGDDFYLVDSADDGVLETAGGGLDYVFTTASYTLQAGSHVEVLAAYVPSATTALNLTGNELSNRLAGNAGANVLNGGGGSDLLFGGGGGDQFLFDTALGGGNVDAIADLVAGVDSILLDDAVFTGLALGALDADAFVIGTSAQDAEDRIIYDPITGALYFDADGTGAGAAVYFAVAQGTPALSAGDFTVI